MVAILVVSAKKNNGPMEDTVFLAPAGMACIATAEDLDVRLC
jgi:hypothetical protein